MTGRRIEIDELLEVIAGRGRAQRSITAIAGPPGAGKSTLAEMLAERLNEGEPGSAAVLPMDGYHFDDMVLLPRGLRPRKGAPETFDVLGFAHMVRRLKRNDEPEIAVPVFDRSLEIARAGGRMIGKNVRHLIVEGNYVLLDEAPWSDLAAFFDTTVMITVSADILRARLEARWVHLAPDEKAFKLDGNDLPNGQRVIDNSRKPEFVFGDD